MVSFTDREAHSRRSEFRQRRTVVLGMPTFSATSRLVWPSSESRAISGRKASFRSRASAKRELGSLMIACWLRVYGLPWVTTE